MLRIGLYVLFMHKATSADYLIRPPARLYVLGAPVLQLNFVNVNEKHRKEFVSFPTLKKKSGHFWEANEESRQQLMKTRFGELIKILCSI